MEIISIRKSNKTVYDIILELGGSDALLESTEHDMKQLFLNEITDDEFHRFCLFKILIHLCNIKGEVLLNTIRVVFL